VGILEYMLEMSSEANLVGGVIGVCSSWCINCVVFLMLKAYGRGVRSWMLCDSNLASL
jgi:preprotein translocase subunit SecF